VIAANAAGAPCAAAPVPGSGAARICPTAAAVGNSCGIRKMRGGPGPRARASVCVCVCVGVCVGVCTHVRTCVWVLYT